jgi:hypothetical protein
MLTPKEAFKVNFLQKCAEEGLTLEEVHEGVKELLEQEKRAFPGEGLLGKAVENIMGAGRDAAGLATRTALIGGLVAPPALGFGTGYMLGKSTDVSDEDAAELKKRQLIAEYRRLTDRISKRKQSPLV